MHLERTFYKLFYNPRIQRHTLRTRGPLPLLAIAAALLCPGHGFDFSTRFLRFETSSCRHLPFTTCSRLMDSFAHDFSFRFPSRMFVSRNLRNCARKVYIYLSIRWWSFLWMEKNCYEERISRKRENSFILIFLIRFNREFRLIFLFIFQWNLLL